MKTLIAEIPAKNGKLIARPRLDTDAIYVLAAANMQAEQSVLKLSIGKKIVEATFPGGNAGTNGFAIDLDPQEKEIYVLNHAVPGDDVPQLARVQRTGKAVDKLPAFSAGTSISEIQVLDSRRILYATAKEGKSAGIYDIEKGTTTPFFADYAYPNLSFPYAFSPDGRSIFSM
jgi:hypothetical protein